MRRRLGRGATVALVVGAALTLTGSGLGVAAYRYDRANLDRILPGVAVGGVDVGGLTYEEALELVADHAAIRLEAPMDVRAGGERWIVTPAELGMRADVEGAVRAALDLNSSYGAGWRVWYRLREEPLGVEIPLPYSVDEELVDRFVDGVAAVVAVPPRNASIAAVDGELRLRSSQGGRALRVQLARLKVLGAMERNLPRVDLPVTRVAPKVSERSLGQTIVVRRDVNELFLYEGLEVARKYPVATAAAGYVTPPGTWTLVNKQVNPTWYNPAPDTWGADLPLVIPPGPGNPLGTRALYLNAPGIRIHGTYDVDSIGTRASHGCIRMFMEDVEELYELVPIGTTVIVL